MSVTGAKTLNKKFYQPVVTLQQSYTVHWDTRAPEVVTIYLFNFDGVGSHTSKKPRDKPRWVSLLRKTRVTGLPRALLVNAANNTFLTFDAGQEPAEVFRPPSGVTCHSP
ncbi:hypothetical protein Bbelb_370670 [Branchiostoma belcheri]|nr:hypothetical protein Bbelb_370670 [Branchiostoma belcheri]